MDKLLACEKAYIECFSETMEENGLMIFTDPLMSDMYDHNFIFVTSIAEQSYVTSKLEEQFVNRPTLDFCHIVFASCFNKTTILEIASQVTEKMKLVEYGRYQLKNSKIPSWTVREDCEIRLLETKEDIDDIIAMDIIMDGDTVGEDFCIRRARRKGEAILNHTNLNKCLLYYEKKLIGSCETFIMDGIAKIEDFAVLPDYRRKGFGTTLLKYGVNLAIKDGAELIILDTDEEDTAREMYQKLGFSKVGGNLKLFWADWMRE